MRWMPCLIVLALVASAHAEPPGLTGLTPLVALPAPAPVMVTEESYRLQTLLSDLTVVGLGVVASKNNGSGDTLGPVAVGVYFLGAPAVHIAHHHYARAAASLALRVGLPLLGVAIGSALGKGQCSEYCDNDSDIAGAVFGGMVGVLAASLIDIGYLSRGETVQPPGVASSMGTSSPTVKMGFTF
jgi:hypothetical protein